MSVCFPLPVFNKQLILHEVIYKMKYLCHHLEDVNAFCFLAFFANQESGNKVWLGERPLSAHGIYLRKTSYKKGMHHLCKDSAAPWVPNSVTQSS